MDRPCRNISWTVSRDGTTWPRVCGHYPVEHRDLKTRGKVTLSRCRLCHCERYVPDDKPTD